MYKPSIKRYLTTLTLETNRVRVFTEQDDYKSAVDDADEWVWQYATCHLMAMNQHHAKMEAWEANPNLETY